MRHLCRLLAPLVFGLFALTACSPSADKPSASPTSASQPSAAPPPAADRSTQPATVPTTLQNGGQYATLASKQATEPGSKVEVLEFFGYFCNHCHALDPAMSAWAKKQGNRITFKRIPIRPDEAKLYYALEAMGKLDALHEKIFNAVQIERKRLNTDSAAADVVAQFGVDKNAFLEQYNSFSVQSKAVSAINTTKAYGIDGVPMVVIDGRFVTSASHAAKRPGTEQSEAGLHASMLLIMDELVAKTCQDRAAGTKPSVN